jgi:ABC-type transport system substrate-binding protein/class 3 adenylate cyclase
MSVAAGERRIISVLVADVADSTSIAEKLGPERSKFLFDDVAQLMRRQVERFGGTIAQLTGDGILALFGAPLAHEDDSTRAVRAAIAIHEELDGYSAGISDAYGTALRARVAVNTGPVVIPADDAPPDVLYNALGDTVNVAARLQSFGPLVVGPATARQVIALFELAELGRLELKGKTEPVPAYMVTGVRPEPVEAPELQLVGRVAEMSTLEEALAGLHEGRGAIVSVTGEPGIGKSRLVAEGRRRFAGQVRFLTGNCVGYAETNPYWPVRELLRDWLGLGVSDPETRLRLELRANLTELLGERGQEAYPFLAALFGLALEPDQESRLGNLASDAVQRETFNWIFELVSALAAERPLCLVLEDLHWSDETTLALLAELLPATEETGVCFVLVHRSDPDHPAWQLVDGARRRFPGLFVDVNLAPLPESDVKALAELDAGGGLPEELAAMLSERTGGNPFFIQEALRDLRERGVLARRDDRFELTGEAAVPAAVQEALQARLGRLDAEAREVITTAAVIGRTFGLPLLGSILPRIRLRSTISELIWLRLVVEERRDPTPEYRFRHGLVREVAYGTLLEAQRRALHRRVGEALLDLHRGSPAEVYGLLAHHFSEADDPGLAVEYLLKAGDAARAGYAEDEAIELYERALVFMERTGDNERARKTLLRIGLSHHIAFSFEAAAQAFEAAFREPTKPASPRGPEPTERLTWATPLGWAHNEIAPGHCLLSDLASQVTRHLFRGLVEVGPDLEIAPDLAAGLTVSDDGRCYRFTLREDAHWSDGAPVTANDFAFTFARMRADGGRSAPLLEGVRTVVCDERTLEIRLQEPDNQFLYALASPALFPWPEHVYARLGPDWFRDTPLVGCGPFVLSEHDDARLVLNAAPRWYGPHGNVGQVVIERLPPATAGNRWRSGEFDCIYEHLAGLVGITESGDTVVQRAPGGTVRFLSLNARAAPFDDARLRLAAAHAIDRRALPQARSGLPADTGGLLPPAIPGHSPRAAPAYDPERARALLEAAGHAGGRGLAEVALAHLPGSRTDAAVLAAHLETVGFRVRLLAAEDVVEFTTAIRKGVHAHASAAVGLDSPDPVRGFLRQAARDEPTVYWDGRLDELLARALTTRDQDERLRLCREIERIWIGELAAVVPLSYEDAKVFRRPWVEGLWAHPIGRSTFADAVVGARE